MDDPSSHDPVAQLVAWHNRHPLAQRITPDDVIGVGGVVLPFVAADAAASASWKRWPKLAWDRLLRLARRPSPAANAPALKAAFSEDFIAPISPRRAADLALRHGSRERMGDPQLPQREVPADEGVPAEEVVHLYLTTAAVERGMQRSRVLMGGAQTLGARLWSRRRVSRAAGALAGLVALSVVGWPMLSGPADGPAERAATPASQPAPVTRAASGAAAPASSTSLPVVAGDATASAPQSPSSAAQAASASEASVSASAAPAPAPTAAAASSALPVTAHPKPPVPDLATAEDPPAERLAVPAKQSLRPALSSADRAEAVRQSQALRSAAPLATASASRVKFFALVASLTGTRDASERRLRMIGLSFAAGKMAGDLRSEIVQVDKGWRATLWPFDSRAEAQAARDLLEERGVYTKVVAF